MEKKSVEIKRQIEAEEAAYDDLIQQMVYQNPARTVDNHDALWAAFWKEHGNTHYDRVRQLEADHRRALNMEIEVGDGVTLHLWSDAQAHTVIKRTAKTLTIQRDKAIRDPNFKPEWVPGGFSAICTNSDEQEWTYERDPNGSVTRCHWSEKYGIWQAGSDGSMKVTPGRYEHYDYNF